MKSAFFSEDHEKFRADIRRFMAAEITPHINAWEQQGQIPSGIWKKLGDSNLLGINLPKSYGGSDADFFFSVVLLEEMSRAASGGFRAAISAHQYMALAYIQKFGSDALKNNYLKPGVSGRLLGAFAVTEPEGGSDIAAIRTTAVREGDSYVVNGTKVFITNGSTADFIVTAARTARGGGPAGISLLVIDRKTPGLSCRVLEKTAWKCSDVAELTFDKVRIPTGQLVGDENMGFYYIMEGYQLERLVASVSAVSLAEHALKTTIEFLSKRQAFSRPLSRYQAVRHRLSDCLAELEAARHLNYHACWLYDQQLPAIRESTMAKLVSTELARKVTDICLQYHGGYGLLSSSPIARMHQDARPDTIAGGTSEIMREIISKMTFDVGVVRPEEDVQAVPEARPSETPPAAVEPVAIVDPADKPADPPQSASAAVHSANDDDDEATILRESSPPEKPPVDDEISAFQNEIERVITPSDHTVAAKKPQAAKGSQPAQQKPALKHPTHPPEKAPENGQREDNNDSFSQEEIWEIQEELEKIINSADLPAAASPKAAAESETETPKDEEEDKTVMLSRPEIESKFPAQAPRNVPPPQDPTVEELFNSLEERFRPDKTENYHGIFHYSISGEGGGNYTVMINDGECHISEGLVGEADCLIHTNAPTFVDVELGRANQQVAFMMGKIKVSNVAQMMQFSTFFNKFGVPAE